MQEIYQKSISTPIYLEGIGLHSGKNSKIKIIPAKEDQGIVFKRIDLKKENLIEANYKNVSSAKLCTTLENQYGAKVSTVEHLLAALYIAGVDNAIIEIDNEEVPIMDGSAKEFLEIIQKTEIKTQTKKRKYLKILNKVELIDGSRKISIEPNSDYLEVDFQLNYKNEIIGKQRNLVNFQLDNLDKISQSRTFCLFEDIEKIKKIGLAKGGTLENAVVVDDKKVLNAGGLRNQKEFVNHKILDLAGDFLLSGHRILGKVVCYQGGHELTNMFLRKLLNSKHSVRSIELNNIEISKKINSDQSIKVAVNA
jgi:UDP-3-O-[3-hydroxymyristoyl] N-acetylglucosamine deacetylase